MNLDLARLTAIGRTSDGELTTTTGIKWYPATDLLDAVSVIEAQALQIEHLTASAEAAATEAKATIDQHEANAIRFHRVMHYLGQAIGPAAYKAEDGSVSSDVQHAKLPSIVGSLINERDALRSKASDLEADNQRMKVAAALNASESAPV